MECRTGFAHVILEVLAKGMRGKLIKILTIPED